MALFEDELIDSVATTDPMQSGFTPTLLDTTAFTDPSNLAYLRTLTESLVLARTVGFVDHGMVTEGVALQPFTNAKEPWTYVDSQARYLSHASSQLRVVSNVAASSLTVQTLVTNGGHNPTEMYLLFVSSRYFITAPTGWIRRYDTIQPGVATGANGSLYFTIWQLDPQYYSLYPYGTNLTIDQGFPAPLCVVFTKWQSFYDAYPVFISAHESHLSNQATDQATPPLVNLAYENEARIIAMTADPHPTSGTSTAPAGYLVAAPSVTYPTTDSNNIVVAYNPVLWNSQNATGILAMHTSPVYTTANAVMSIVLRYRMLGPIAFRRLTAYEGAVDPDFTYNWTTTETVTNTDIVRAGWHQVVTEPPVFSGSATPSWTKSASIAVLARILDPTAQKLTFKPVLTEAPRTGDSVQVAWPKAISEALGISPAVAVSRVVRVLEALGLVGVLAPRLSYRPIVADGISAIDLLARFASGAVVESLATTASLAQDYRFHPVLSESLSVAATANRLLALRVITSETLNLSDTRVLKLLFKPELMERVTLSLAYVAPGHSVTTWTVNTRTGAATEYTNFDFNSFAQLGRSYLAASSSGLYELRGDDDAGTDIIAALKTGYSSYPEGRPIAFKAAYLGVRGSGEFFFKIDMADGREVVYRVVAKNMDTTKINLGKGLRARYFAFELVSTGQDFDLESIEYVPLMSQRHQ